MPVRDIYKHIGQFAIVGFDGQVIPPELRALVRQFDLGGVIYFARNIEEPEQVAELSQEIQSLGDDLPLWVSIDQEGGRVQPPGKIRTCGEGHGNERHGLAGVAWHATLLSVGPPARSPRPLPPPSTFFCRKK